MIALFSLLVLLGASSARADEGFGQRTLGTIGLDAGTQGDPGIYLGDRYLHLGATRLLGRDGKPLPVPGLDVSSWGNAFALAGTFLLRGGTYFTAAVAAPIAGVRSRSDLRPTTLDREGLADVYLQPVKLGWRLRFLDVVGSYGVYAPTSQLQRNGLAESQWTHQLSLGGTMFFDDERSTRVSALASWNLYQRKPDVDVTRGQTVQVQGGVGRRFFRLVDLGVAFYGLWQVSADTGSDIPPRLLGLRETGVGLGPEFGVLLPWIRGKLTARYEWQVFGRSRLDGRVLVVSLNLLAHRSGR